MKVTACTSLHQAHTRVWSFFWRAGLGFLACVAAFSSLAQATTTASVNVSPNTILSGGTVTITGAGFDANTLIMLWLDTNGNGKLDPEEPVMQPTIQTDGTGAVPGNSTWIMTDVPAGSFFIQAGICQKAPVIGLCYGTVGAAQAQLTITMGLSHSAFGSGTTVAVTGYGFSPNDSVNVWYDNSLNGAFVGGSTSASPATDPNGAFSASLLVNGSPGDYFIHVGPSASTAAADSIKVNIGTCWFQDCFIDGADTICLLGNSPSDLVFLGVHLADCKQVDSNYTVPTGITLANVPPGGYDLNNQGPRFLGAGVLAAATVDLGPPGTGCAAMGIAIANAEASHNSVPDKVSGLLPIACGIPPLGVPPLGLGAYITPLEICVLGVGPCNHVPDKDFIIPAVLALGGPAAPPPVQLVVAEAAVAGAIACGYVNFYCDGKDITNTILENPDLQRHEVPITFLQPPIKSPPSPNPCAAAGVNKTCWGDIIGWSKVTCKELVSSTPVDNNGHGSCENPDAQGAYPELAIPGSAGSPDNSLEAPVCATGTVIGLSIGYDGDVSFDITGPGVLTLVNYHNFLPGPGGSEPPNGLDIEIPVADRPLFLPTLVALRPGMDVRVCGRWVADMHMLWNELHPVTFLSILPSNRPPSADAGSPQTLEATSPAGATVNLSGSGTDPDNDPLTFSWSEGPTPLSSGAQIAVTLSIGVHTITLTADDGRGGKGTATVSITVQDTTPPTFTPPANQTLEATSPAGAVAVFSATATDIVDGTLPVNCLPASGSTFPFGTTTVNCTATDLHGNSSAGKFTILVRDTIAPKIACGSPDAAWHATDVSIACAASDTGSGLANPADANFLLSTSVPSLTETPTAQTSSRSVCDLSGNCATAGPLAPIKVDKKGPSITITTPASGAAYVLNQSVTVSYSCTDGGSGLNTCTGTVANGSALVTSSIGSKSLTVNASDKVGNASNKTSNYSITYNICLLYDPTKAKKSGSTYPIKIQLCDVAGQNVSSPAIIVHAVSVTMKSSNAPGILDDAGNANPDFDFRYDSGGYMFNLKTTGNSTGTYNLNFTAGADPNTHSVPFEIK